MSKGFQITGRLARELTRIVYEIAALSVRDDIPVRVVRVGTHLWEHTCGNTDPRRACRAL